MANSLIDLERSVARWRKRPHKNAIAARAYAKSGRGSKTLSTPLDYAVPGDVPALAQQSGMACWATVFTMLQSWKSRASMSVETALGKVGQKWVTLFRNDTGLTSAQKVEFVAAAGLVAEPPQSYSVEGWEQLLRTYGPLWVTTDEAPGANWAIHARVITAIQGDGTPEGTAFSIIDPAGGRQYKEKISVFVPKFEEEVIQTGRMRIQVLHWPKGAQLSGARSLRYGYGSSLVGRALSDAVVSGDGKTAVILPAPAEPPPARATITPARVKAATPAQPTNGVTPDLNRTVAELIARGADKAALLAFLKDLKAPVSLQAGLSRPFAGPQATVTLPTGVVLEGHEAMAFRAAVHGAISTLPGVGTTLAALLAGLPALANRFNVTIGVGPSVSGGLVTGASFGAGILFAPGDRLGYYGSVGGVLGAIVSISATLQVTVIKGGPENFGGSALLTGITIDTGVGPAVGAYAILANGKFLGVTGEVGASAGLSPFEAFAEFQYTATSLSLAVQARQLAGPALFGIAGLGAVEAIEIGLGAIGLASEIGKADGGLAWASDQADRLLAPEARVKLGEKAKAAYSYPLLWVGEIKQGFADALFLVKWEGNAYGEMAGLRVVRDIHNTTDWRESELNVSFRRIRTLPPPEIKDPREWPIVFEYDGTFNPYGNGYFTFQGAFAANAFGGLKHLRHEISDKSFASFLKMGSKTDYVRKKPDQSYTVPKIPDDQLAYLKERLDT